MNATNRYLEAELEYVRLLSSALEGGNGQFKIKICSELGSTRWLNITPKQFEAIENAMLAALDDDE